MSYDPEEPENFIKNDELFKSCSVLKISDIYELELAKLMYKASNHMLPRSYDDILKPLSSRQAPITRAASRNEFYQSLASTVQSERKISFAGPNLWKSISPELKSYSFKSFKKMYKKSILERY